MTLEQTVRQEEAALESLVEFRRVFLPAPGDVESAPFHHQWSDTLLRGRGNIAIEAFRESAKTQIVIRANLLHALAYPQSARSYIVIICANGRAASKRLYDVSREARVNRDIAAMIAATVEDSGSALEVATHGQTPVRIEAYGKGAAVRGLSWGAKRFDLVIVDDPQDAEDARSETVTDTDWDWFLSDVVFLGQNSRIFLIGNNLGERCVVERVLAHADTLGFTASRVPILDGDGNSAWPEKWPREAVEKERGDFARLGRLDIWYREKMCEVVAPDSQMFKREDFRYYAPAEFKASGLSIYMTVDPAASEAESADRTAVCVVGVGGAGHWFVLDHWAGRVRPSEAVNVIFRLVSKWRPLVVGIEAVAYQAALEDFLYKEMPRRNIFFRVQKLRAAKKKELRIETALQTRFALHTIWFPAQTSWAAEIEDELLAFPRGLHDDRIDALAYIDQVAVVPNDDRGGTPEPIDCDI